MLKLLTYLMLVAGPSIASVIDDTLHGTPNVHLKVTTTADYCNGARPSEDQLEYLRTPKPAAGYKLYLKKGGSNTIDSPIFLEITADGEGMVSLDLPEGTYLIVSEAKKDGDVYRSLVKAFSMNSNWHDFDEACLKKWFETPDIVIIVKGDSISNLTHNFHKKCYWNKPCASWGGPYPP